MAGNEEGGVRTKKVILASLSVLAVMMLIFIPASQSSSGAQFGIEGGKTLFGTGDVLNAEDENGIRVFSDGTIYNATMKVVNSDGVTQSGAVYPTSYRFTEADPDVGLTITAPRTAGNYVLVVEFQLTSSATSEKVTRTYPLKVVDPIILSVDIKNNNKTTDVKDLSLQFIIDGRVMDLTDETTNLTIAADSVKTVSYRWVTDNPGGGRHTFSVQVHEDSEFLADLLYEKNHTFYVGQTSYTWLMWILGIVVFILFLVLIWVIRKPVKNFGKPKGRRK